MIFISKDKQHEHKIINYVELPVCYLSFFSINEEGRAN